MIPPILSFFASLPSPPGPHPVGYAHITCPPIAPFAHPFPLLKSTSKPAFSLSHVGYAVFYPCNTDYEDAKGKHQERKKGFGWVPEPMSEIIKGYGKFAGGKGAVSWFVRPLGYFASRLLMPVYPLAPISPAQRPSAGYPLIIFSHGLAGTRHTYSQYCAALASEGYAVLAVEHRDGSGPAVMLPPDKEGGEPKVLYYTGVDDIQWEEGEEQPVNHARTLQLEMRSREVYEVYNSFINLTSATPNPELEKTVVIEKLEGNDKQEERQAWINGLKGQVDGDDLRLIGHSFGGGTMLHLLQTSVPHPYTPLPTTQALVLDPWLDPLPLPSDILSAPPFPSAEHKTLPPLFVVNSPGFTEWGEHFSRLVGIAKGWKNGEKNRAGLVTLLGIGHQTFSDFPLLSPTPAHARSMLLSIHTLSAAFLSSPSTLASLPEIQGQKPDGGQYEHEEKVNGEGERLMKGKKGRDGQVVVHLLADDQ
ncbi:1-alkyl-2-acetylglycerophosphocholine esterase [Cryptococcus wingfieldii CBS 7118]|uniref:Putative phospholipase n=1 Tax=Cryptococcus wingfieldii CBS 7118 TaxID=1295528 RepID=A0A1E3IQ57_9TREE|nr:1-alkyl-2-acetylglycerophosphocholine esterase [Cryptococcus wingfieldii CBS 7118]ODN90734.1 1-alkyl-2-acetylglycerophosphocholine esterase [Cryptococcus wingfieldii CBS 7118]